MNRHQQQQQMTAMVTMLRWSIAVADCVVDAVGAGGVVAGIAAVSDAGAAVGAAAVAECLSDVWLDVEDDDAAVVVAASAEAVVAGGGAAAGALEQDAADADYAADDVAHANGVVAAAAAVHDGRHADDDAPRSSGNRLTKRTSINVHHFRCYRRAPFPHRSNCDWHHHRAAYCRP